jgi:hypothetical protein
MSSPKPIQRKAFGEMNSSVDDDRRQIKDASAGISASKFPQMSPDHCGSCSGDELDYLVDNCFNRDQSPYDGSEIDSTITSPRKAPEGCVVAASATADVRSDTSAQMPVLEQWGMISDTPMLLRYWHLFVACTEASITVTVHVYGWHQAGAPVAMFLPPLFSAMFDLIVAAAYWHWGPLISNATIVRVIGPVQGMLGLYTMVMPLYLPVNKVLLFQYMRSSL